MTYLEFRRAYVRALINGLLMQSVVGFHNLPGKISRFLLDKIPWTKCLAIRPLEKISRFLKTTKLLVITRASPWRGGGYSRPWKTGRFPGPGNDPILGFCSATWGCWGGAENIFGIRLKRLL